MSIIIELFKLDIFGKIDINYIVRIYRYIVLFLFAIFAFNSCTQHGQRDFTKRPLRVLFVGNSLTNFNGGLDYLLRKMFAQSNPKLLIYADKIAPGGERLSGHFAKGKALKKIKDKNWDIVVLQEYSNGPIINKEDFYKYAKFFVNEIRKNGSNAIFYMTFSYKDNTEMTPILSKSYFSVAKDLKCNVVPVGLAWQRVTTERPTLEMYTDFKHPNPNGSYLAACMFYSYLTGIHPSNSKFINKIDADVASYLQDVAWETVNEWKRSDTK